MAYLDRADCVTKIKFRLNRPSSDTAFTVSSTDDVILSAMTDAQDEITKLIATFIPDCMITAPTALTTADGGRTYTFGTDVDTAAIFPLGHFQVFANKSDIPDIPLEPGVDFEVEGTKIRITNDQQRTFGSGGPWAQTVNASNVINASTQPSIPVICRQTLIEKTCALCARRLGLDPTEYQQAAEDAWLAVLAAVRTQAAGKGGPPIRQRNHSWISGFGFR